MREPCKIVHDTLEFVGSRIKAGMSTKEVDELVERYIRSSGRILPVWVTAVFPLRRAFRSTKSWCTVSPTVRRF